MWEPTKTVAERIEIREKKAQEAQKLMAGVGYPPTVGRPRRMTKGSQKATGIAKSDPVPVEISHDE